MTRDQPTIPDVTLERYHLDELPSTEAARVAARASVDPAMRARLEAIGRSNTSIHEALGPDWPARAVSARLSDSSRRRVPLAGGRGRAALAGAAVVLVAAIAMTLPDRRPWAGDSDGLTDTVGPDRIKGEAAMLLVFRKAGVSSEPLIDGAAARRGDLLRVAYRASAARFGVIVSIDGRGLVTRHLPLEGPAAAALVAGESVPLSDAYELDDAPRLERFFLVTSESVFDVETVVEAARRAASAAAAQPSGDGPAVLALPAGLDQSSFLIRKVS